MARNGRRRKNFGKYMKGQVHEELALGTLNGDTLIAQVMSDNVTERTRISSLVATYSLEAVTVSVNDGPIMVGIAHSDYSDAEIEAWIENANSWSQADLISREVSQRRIRRIGIFRLPVGMAAGVSWSLNSGRPVKTKLNWMLMENQSLKLWAFNLGSSALATTNPVVRAEGHVNLWG